MNQRLFKSFFIGGLECSTHRRRDGKRLDLLSATRHDELAARDFSALQAHGMFTARSGVRWHRAEPEPGRYDFSAELPMIRAARDTGTQVIWDLFHYGWPDFLDFYSEDFLTHFRDFARAFARVLADETDGRAWISPANEISFFAWAGGDAGFLNPFAIGRGDATKAQLVRAALLATDAVREVLPRARFVQPEPVIHIVPHPRRPQDAAAAEGHRQAQFAAWDMMAGRQRPELGGSSRHLDVLGLNYYIQNQWVHNTRRHLKPGHPSHRPFREILLEVYQRYRKPLFVSETGVEGRRRPAWLAYMAGEVRAALEMGIPVEGLCLYPVLDYPGWDDDRYCPSGLLSYPDAGGRRKVYRPLADELERQQALIGQTLSRELVSAAD